MSATTDQTIDVCELAAQLRRAACAMSDEIVEGTEVITMSPARAWELQSALLDFADLIEGL